MNARRTSWAYGLLIDRMTNPIGGASAIGDGLGPVVEEAVKSALAATPAREPWPPALLDVEGVAEWLGVSVRKVESLIAEGELVPIRVGAARRFSTDALLDYARRAAAPRRKRRRKG